MRFQNVAIPAEMIWSSPFARWQGMLAQTSSLDLASSVTRRALSDRGMDLEQIDDVMLGMTVPQPEYFFGPPTLAGQLGIPARTGPIVSQACATTVAALQAAATSAQVGEATELVVTTDRTSNGPTLIYPTPGAPGGAPSTEDFVRTNFAFDPWSGTSMLAAAELVAAEHGIGRDELDDLTALRSAQYQRALAEDRRFQRRYMVPVEVLAGRNAVVLDEDEGVRAIDRDHIRALRPAVEDGLHTGATQTHPADGCAGAIVTTVDTARDLSAGPIVHLLATGFARVAPTHMPEAPVPAALQALAAAELSVDQVDAITTHNPFAVNDILFARATGIDLTAMNAFGSSLIWGHPQAPTGMRAIAELVTELTERGGGVGLFTGCAAGDTAAALVIRVDR